MPKIDRGATPSTLTANGATVGNAAASADSGNVPTAAPSVPESVEALRSSPLFAEGHRGTLADRLASVLGVEWPARAYRRWDRVERTGEARTWRRELAGVGTA